MKVSKVVLIVVALHVLVIGGIFVFEGCSRAKSPVPPIADNEVLPGGATDLASTDSSAMPMPVPVPVSSSDLSPAMPIPAPIGQVTPTAPLAAPVAPVAASTEKVYTVVKGDSLYRIARREKITVDQLAQANNLSKNGILQIGQKLTIPALAPTQAPVPTMMAGTAAEAPSPVNGQVYEVKSGDSLWKISRAHGTTVAALKQANNLSSDMLQVGQKLVIPSAPVAPAVDTTQNIEADGVPAMVPSSPAVIAPGIATP